MKQEILFKQKNIQMLNEEIQQAFENIVFCELGEIDFGGKIIACFVQFNTSQNLKDEWKDFNNFITAKHLPNIKDEYSKWNFYIFYISTEIVSKELKYEIENNKFSSRKIIIENIVVVNQEFIQKTVSEYITNDCVRFKVKVDEIEIFSRNLTINQALTKSSFNRLKTIKEENLIEALYNLEKTLKDEN